MFPDRLRLHLRHITSAFISAAALLITIIHTGCQPRQTLVEAARETQTLHIGNGAEPQDLDPQTTIVYTDYNILIALFEGLTVIDEATSEPIPGTASHWDISDDGLRYTFHIRPTARWSNGDPVTAQDFVFSFQRILSPALGAEYAYMLYAIKNAEDYNTGALTDFAQVGVRATAPLALEITLSQPTPQLLSLAAHQAWFPVHPPTILAHGRIDQRDTRWTVPGKLTCNGPYTLKEWLPNQRIVVTRNPLYWDAALTENGNIREVVFYPTDNIAADEAAFRTGRLHLTYDILPDRMEHYRRTAPGQLRIDPLLETLFVRFNTKLKPLDDIRVRRALALAIDRESIAQQLLLGSRLPAHHYTPPNTAGYTADARQPHDPDAARRLLAEAGFPDGKGFPKFEIQMNTDALNSRIFEAIQAMWKRELGIETTLVSLDFRAYLENQRTIAYQITRSRWVGDYNDPNTFLDMFITGGGNNQTAWSNPAYDRAIAEAASATERAPRFAAFQRAEKILLDDAPIAPVVFGARTYLISPDVQGWPPSLLGIHRYQTVRLAKTVSSEQ
ncbi:peptide ABC transporter substrate-binding protein [Opitutaceae bacterium TAV4]|nr:peptide ABC transporter substrate-binding protein [Opitutaceae bacterium TAV4]RRK00062.1 peptide ABC transporter substrate-binding protein [Opitutaceae bacterium TAV3]